VTAAAIRTEHERHEVWEVAALGLVVEDE